MEGPVFQQGHTQCHTIMWVGGLEIDSPTIQQN